MTGGIDRHTRILVVDDEPQLLRLVARVLRRDGYQVTEAPDSDIALEQLDKGDKLELAVIDLNVPPAGGGVVMRRVVERHPGVRIVMTSGAELDVELSAELAAAGGSFLRKPFSPRILCAVVERSLAGESLPEGLPLSSHP